MEKYKKKYKEYLSDEEKLLDYLFDSMNHKAVNFRNALIGLSKLNNNDAKTIIQSFKNMGIW